MASVEEEEQVITSEAEVADVLQGSEPGASQEPLFETNPLEDVDFYLDEQYDGTEAISNPDVNSVSSKISTLSRGGSKEAHASESLEGFEIVENEGECENDNQNNSGKLEAKEGENQMSINTTDFELEVENLSISDKSDHEDVNHPDWIKHKKHIFIFTDAGKPIYCRYGMEDKLATLFGVMQALVSFVQDDNNCIRSMVAGKHKFVFLVRSHIILVAVSYRQESEAQLVVQLTYLYNQILTVLTYTQLCRVMTQRRNYDLRRLLAGTEKFIDNLINLMDHEPSFLLGAVRCLPLHSSVRYTIGQSLLHAKCPDLVFAILVAQNQLITLVRPKRYSLHPSDLHLIFNLVSCSKSIKSADIWTPICLPRFDNSGYLYAHASYLDEECPACLLLLSTDKNAFFSMAEAKQKIVDRLVKYNCLKAITESFNKDSYRVDQIGIPELRHFVYKSKSTAQYTSPEIGAPYLDPEEQERLFGLYLYLHHRIHMAARPLKILSHVGPKEMLLGWVTSGFEIYAAFSPLVTKPTAVNAINKLLRWIKREEDRLFILTSELF